MSLTSPNTLMQASHQWATRPADERFLSLTELKQVSDRRRKTSTSKVVSSRAIEVRPLEDDPTHKGIAIYGPNGGPVIPNNWSFGQIASLAGAPGKYLTSLAAPLAADCINYGLRFNRDIEDIGVLVRKEEGFNLLSAATGPGYGRVWNSTIVESLINKFGDGVTGDFRVPGEFGKRVEITRDNTTIYAGDRDMFVFLADEDNRIEIPNRRNSLKGTASRGFFVWNSEVGNRTMGVATFLFDYACCNRIVWGVTGYNEIKVRHTTSAPDRWMEEVTPAIQAYAEGSAKPIEDAIKIAQAKKVDDIDAFLKSRSFSSARSSAIKAAFQADEQRPMENLWDVATGITAYARQISWQDQRVQLESQAGKVLNLATN